MFCFFHMNYLRKCYICLKIWLSAVIGGVTVPIIYFTSDSCGPDSCPEYKKCKSLNGFDFECVVNPFECDGLKCCEDGPNPICCLNGGFCSNETFIFNGTNSDDCQCNCNDFFTGNFALSQKDGSSIMELKSSYVNLMMDS